MPFLLHEKLKIFCQQFIVTCYKGPEQNLGRQVRAIELNIEATFQYLEIFLKILSFGQLYYLLFVSLITSLIHRNCFSDLLPVDWMVKIENAILAFKDLSERPTFVRSCGLYLISYLKLNADRFLSLRQLLGILCRRGSIGHSIAYPTNGDRTHMGPQ